MFRTGLVLALLAAALAGCGAGTPVAANGSVELALTEYRLTPERLSAHAGELSILAHNYGRLVHNLVVSSGGHPLAVTKPIAPGASRWLFVDLAPGTYTMASNLFSDQDLGMYGTLTVTR